MIRGRCLCGCIASCKPIDNKERLERGMSNSSICCKCNNGVKDINTHYLFVKTSYTFGKSSLMVSTLYNRLRFFPEDNLEFQTCICQQLKKQKASQNILNIFEFPSFEEAMVAYQGLNTWFIQHRFSQLNALISCLFLSGLILVKILDTYLNSYSHSMLWIFCDIFRN